MYELGLICSVIFFGIKTVSAMGLVAFWQSDQIIPCIFSFKYRAGIDPQYGQMSLTFQGVGRASASATPSFLKQELLLYIISLQQGV